MSEIRVATKQQSGVVLTRPVPIPHVQISATTSGGANTVYTVRTGAMLKVLRLAVANVTASAATLNLNAIPDGGSIGNSNAEFGAISIPANTSADLTPYIGGLYTAGMVLKAYSDTSNALTIHGWGEEIL